MSSIVMTRDEVALELRVDNEAVDRIISSGKLNGFLLGEQWLTTPTALQTMVNAMMQPVLPSETTITSNGGLPPLPTREQMDQLKWTPPESVRYTSRDGGEGNWAEDSVIHTFYIGGKTAPLVIHFRHPDHPIDRWAATVYWGVPGHGLQPIVEWLTANDYEHSHRVASVIKYQNKSMVRPDQPLPPEYEQSGLEFAIYNEVVTKPYSKVARGVVASESDYASVALHALIRCRQKGWI